MSNARVVIEGLRSGVPYRETAQAMTVGRDGNLRELGSLMETVSQGRHPKLYGQVLRAQYGEGKTHLLHALANQAWEANWVVSMVSISKESPLDRLDYLYSKITQKALRPGSRVSGLTGIVDEAVREPMLVAGARDLELSMRTRTVLDNVARQNTGLDDLISDLEGQFLNLVEIKRIHRENFTKPLKIPTTPIKDEIPSYLLLVDWLIQRAGYAGWLILFDEVELMGKFGRGARARSYATIGRFLSGMAGHTLTIWAVAGNFQTDVLMGRHDIEQVPEWLLSRPKEAFLADWAKVALDELSAARPLAAPTSAQIQELVQHVYDLHQEAYQWTAPVPREQFYELVKSNLGLPDQPLRTWVRLAISLMDLWLVHGPEGGEARVATLGEVDLSEDADVDSDPIQRRRIFE